jgi:O-antigen/teichoic acid export membrane protein
VIDTEPAKNSDATESHHGQNLKLVRLLSGRLLARNSLWTLLGNGLPLLVALWAVPALIHGLGAARFGLLTIIWMGIGYLNLFDLGTGRALTKLVAERLGDGRDSELPELIKIGLRLMFALGCAAAVVGVAITPWITNDLLRIPMQLRRESEWSFLILAATLPFVISTAGLIGVLQAHQRFSAVAAVRIPMGILTFIGPVMVLSVTPSLVATTAVLASCRILAWSAYGLLSRDVRRRTEGKPTAAPHAMRELLSFGGWVTISNVIGPLMVYFDRFVIGALLSMTAVAYYTTPFDVVTRLTVISGALISVLFPALTTALAGDPVRARAIFIRAAGLLIVAVFIPLSLIMLFASLGLRLWLNPAFATAGLPVVKWLTVGILVNSAACLPYAVLQGKGRPDLTGVLHLAELPIYGVVLWVLVRHFGIVGAAAAWTIRVAIDGVALFVLGIKYVPELRDAQMRAMLLTTVAASLLAVLVIPHTLWAKVSISTVILAFGAGWAAKTVIPMYRNGGQLATQEQRE